MSQSIPATGPAGYRSQSDDTAADIDRRLFDAYRAMPPWEKARRVDEGARALDQLARAGIRQRYPGAGADETRLRVAALRLDRDTMVRVFGWDPQVHGY